MNILDTIIATKRHEVAAKKQAFSISNLETSAHFNRNTISLSQNLIQSSSGIIGEFKRRSPSKGTINHSASVADIAKIYQNAGVCGISVLTDEKYFGGTNADLVLARESVTLPLLRKDFVIDEYQILEAKSIGADAILLIAAVLTTLEIISLSEFAKSLGLEVLIEVHSWDELEKSIHDSIDMIGVNNRNLKTFEVNINKSKELASFIPNSFVKISESGIQSSAVVVELRKFGFRGFLIGENFMASSNPENEVRQFTQNLKQQ